MKPHILAASLSFAIAGTALYPMSLHADESADIGCKMKFSLSTWSVIYKHSEGNGTVRCGDGESMRVHIVARGAGLTVGKSQVDGGNAKFTDVHRMREVLGSYAEAEAHAGVVKSGDAQVLTKGNVSLALAGAGEGVDLGIDVGEMTLTRIK
jgi:hypothetical protein